MIIFVSTFPLEKFSKDILTFLVPLEFGIVVYKDIMARDTKYELSGIVFIVLIFHKKSLVLYIYDGIF